jgi:hypothetical protein
VVTWTDAVRDDDPAQARDDDGGAALAALLTKAIVADTVPGAAIGHLVGLLRGGLPLVMVSIEDAHAIPARSIVDLYGAHVGRQVVLHFEGGDRSKPIVMGVLRNDDAGLLPPPAAQVQVETDGERVIVVAKDQLVLRCGGASITLTKEGKVLIEGAYVSSHASGVNRIRGGSVHIN